MIAIGDHGRSVSMNCPTCGGSSFAYDKDVQDGPVKCVSCESILSKDELIEANSDNIQSNVDEVKKRVMDDVRRDLKKTFGKFGK